MAFVGDVVVSKRLERPKRRLGVCTRQRVCASGSDVQYSYYQGNSWALKVGERNVLVDPVGAEMAFGNTLLFNQKKSLFAGRKDQTRVFPKPDLIITAQQLPDHLHLPTLRLFDRATPIVSTPGGADILRAEGFTNVKSLKFTESSVELDGDLEVLATAGPILGPPWQLPENGYLLKVKDTGVTFYYEPHSCPQPGALNGLTADVVVIPWDRTVFTPLDYVLVSGKDGAIDVLKTLKPSTVFAINNLTLKSKGILKTVIGASGSFEDFEKTMRQNGVDATIIMPRPATAYPIPPTPTVSLSSSSAASVQTETE